MRHPALGGGRTQRVIRQSAAVDHFGGPVESLGFRLRNAAGAPVVLRATAAGESKQGNNDGKLLHPTVIASRHGLQRANTKVR